MDSKAKKIFLFLFIVLLISIAATFYNTIILQNFLVYTEIDCDSEIESCFQWICDPEIDGEDYCTGNIDEDTWFYKILYINAQNINQCAEDDEDCDPYICESEDSCEEILCSEESLIDFGVEESCVYKPLL